MLSGQAGSTCRARYSTAPAAMRPSAPRNIRSSAACTAATLAAATSAATAPSARASGRMRRSAVTPLCGNEAPPAQARLAHRRQRGAGREAGERTRDEGELQDLLTVARRRLGGVQLRDRRGAGALGRVEVLPLERPHAQLRLVEVRVRRAWQ